MNRPPYLSPSTLAQTATEGGLDEQTIAALVALAERINTNPLLQTCAEALHAQAYEQREISLDPTPDELFGADANKLYLLLAVDAIRLLRAVHEERGLPKAITRESYGALPMSARRYSEWHNGEIGMEEWVFRSWFGSTVATGNLYRLGRMEYIFQKFEGDLRLYRHKESGQLQALAEAGIRFGADGYRPFTYNERVYEHYGWPKVKAAVEGWEADLQEDEETVTGTPLSAYGYAQQKTIILAKSAWELVLQNGDTVLDMHIPNHMPLRLDLLRDSLQRALDFFPRHHAERPFHAFVCDSWIFNTQWVEMLPATSNLLAFQRQGYLFPLASHGISPMYFLFGDQLIDLASAPQDTALRRAVIAHMQAGGKLRTGGFLLMPEDVARFGDQPYR